MAENNTDSKLVEAEVCCAGVSYFKVEPVFNPLGEQRKDKNGDLMFAESRHEATLGERIELTQYEFDRLQALGGVQEPGSKPLPGSPGAPRYATPFGVPVANQEDGELRAFEGPIMGDPNPAGAGLTDLELRNAAQPLTAEEAAALERKASGADDPEAGDDNVAAYDSYMELSKDELVEEAKDRGLTVERGDGGEGEPLKEDYARTLADDDAEDEG